MRKLLVPIDGSTCSLRALAHAIRLATEASPTALCLVNVQQAPAPRAPGGLMNQAAREALQQQGERDLADARGLVDAAGLSYEVVVVFGEPGQTIARLAREHRCVGIVMGTRGLGEVAQVFLGSTAHEVLQEADVPVTLVK